MRLALAGATTQYGSQTLFHDLLLRSYLYHTGVL